MTLASQDNQAVIFTIGHSNRPLAEFVSLLVANAVQRVIDIRTIPRSRHNPQYEQAALATSLSAAGIHYSYFGGLGGLRKPRPDSENTGWRNRSFRAYADHMQSVEFQEALNRLVAVAQEERCTLMCAEAVPWRCHRSLVADALLVRGFSVEDIIGTAPPRKHALTPFAHVMGTAITYPSLL